MSNIIQAIFYLIPGFKIEYFTFITAVILISIGWAIEKHYVSRISFFSNSAALISYFGPKDSINPLVGIVILLYFLLTLWSFIAYATNDRIKPFKEYEDLIENNRQILKGGSSLICGIIIFIDFLRVINLS